MKSKIYDIRREMNSLESSEDRIKCLKDTFIGETMYIVAAGPSLKTIDNNYLINFLKDKLTVSIKQSYDVIKEITDIHLLNFCNLSTYSQINEHAITGWTVWDPNQINWIVQNCRCDFICDVFRNNNDMSKSVAGVGDWDALLFDKQYSRPWGPGLMYEMAIPLGILMGVKKFVLIGWDIGTIDHKEMDNSSHVWDYHSYDENRILGGTQFKMSREEILLTVNSTKSLYYWLKEKNTELEIVSDTNPGYKNIPRIKI